MQTIGTDVSGVCPPVCLSRHSTRLHCAKMAEQIKMLIGVNTFWGLWNTVLRGGPDNPTARGRRIRCSLRQITLASCLSMAKEPLGLPGSHTVGVIITLSASESVKISYQRYCKPSTANETQLCESREVTTKFFSNNFD